ncbi:MAG: hypothetical protein Q9216_005527 [Gyalolechia sp. 2 TL-2023]
MPTTSTPPIGRSLRGIIVLLVSTLVLLAYVFRSGIEATDNVTSKAPSVHTVPALDISTSDHKGNNLPFRLRDCGSYFPSRLHVSHLLKRAGAPRGYGNLICQGDNYLKTIKAAFDGKYPGKEFAPKELDNGWTKSTTLDETDFARVEFRWKPAFESLFGQSKGYPSRSQIKTVSLIQDKPYTTFLGKQVDKPTQAYSEGLYYPSYSLVMSTSSYSAATRIQDQNQGNTKEDRDKLLPTISALSDLMWLAWNTVSSNPKQLRYLARDNIFNEETLNVMDYLFLRDKKETRNVPWPGLEYRGDSDEVKALLATPNGRAIAWLLIDHAQEMKRKGEISVRELKVNIFSVAGDYCMLWDMEPQSPRKRSILRRDIQSQVKYLLTRTSDEDSDHHLGKASNETASQLPSRTPLLKNSLRSKLRAWDRGLVKRDAASDFLTARCTGRLMLAKIESAFNGHGDPVQQFDAASLKNGWSRSDDHGVLSAAWHNYFDKELGRGKVPPSDQINYVRIVQDQHFKNSHGEYMEEYSGTEVGAAIYFAYYMPAISAVVVKNMISPTFIVREVITDMGEKIPSSSDIAALFVPPLHRWSDVTWAVYADIAKDRKRTLRYIGHNFIINHLTLNVMAYIFLRHRQTEFVPFPGLEFGIDAEEGQALLGTPNGMGTAWLLYDRSRELGRRNLRVRIWTEEGKFMMAWNMVPA